MLFVLGIGSNIAMVSCAITTLRDQFPSVKAWQAAVGISICNFSIGLVYVTPVSILFCFFLSFLITQLCCDLLALIFKCFQFKLIFITYSGRTTLAEFS